MNTYQCETENCGVEWEENNRGEQERLRAAGHPDPRGISYEGITASATRESRRGNYGISYKGIAGTPSAQQVVGHSARPTAAPATLVNPFPTWSTPILRAGPTGVVATNPFAQFARGLNLNAYPHIGGLAAHQPPPNVYPSIPPSAVSLGAAPARPNIPLSAVTVAPPLVRLQLQLPPHVREGECLSITVRRASGSCAKIVTRVPSLTSQPPAAPHTVIVSAATNDASLFVGPLQVVRIERADSAAEGKLVQAQAPAPALGVAPTSATALALAPAPAAALAPPTPNLFQVPIAHSRAWQC